MKKDFSGKLMSSVLVPVLALSLLAGCRQDPGDTHDHPTTTAPTGASHTHSYIETVTAPTCTEAGYTLHTCPCGDTYRDTEVAAIGHNWGEWETTLEPTTGAEGKRERKCTVCGNSEEETLPKLPEGHTHSYTETVTAPTCTEAGYTLHTCACGDTYRDAEVAAAGHSWGEWETTLEPTAEAEGKRERKCAVCGTSEEETLPKLPEDHKHSYTVHTVDPTCTEQGYVLYTCGCGHSYKEDIRPALGHSYTETVVAPTCTDAGYTLHTCACGDCFTDQDTQPDPSKHVYTRHIIDAYTFDGYFEVIGSSGTGEPVYVNPPKEAIKYVDDRPACTFNTRPGQYYYVCDLCDHSYVDHDPETCRPTAIDHVPDGEPVKVVEPAMGKRGYTQYRCTACKQLFETDSTHLTAEQMQEALETLADSVILNINTFRNQLGVSSAIKLEKLTILAEERAQQLTEVGGFRHDETKLRELCEKYQYGEYIDMTQYGGTQQYYSFGGGEAIAQLSICGRSIDELGFYIADMFLNSPGHWNYVGAENYAYIAVGIAYTNDDLNDLRVCVFVTQENYG